MKKYRILVSALIILGVFLISTSDPMMNLSAGLKFMDNKENKDIVICIDPGHQSKGDPKQEPVAPGSGQTKARVSSGTSGVATKKPEYILNLEASMILKEVLEQKGYNVIMTRTTQDVNISNAERAMVANKVKADMTVRIHADSLANSGKTGASILVPSKSSKYTTGIYDLSYKCGQIVKDKMTQSGIKVNGIFERGDLTGFNWSTVPVILVEMGFMSNYNEDRMMSDPNYQRKMMQAIGDGIEEYVKSNVSNKQVEGE